MGRMVRRMPAKRKETDMHTCPDCGQACTCNGDIDDLLDCCEDDADNCIHDCDLSDGAEDDGFGCCYPGECCMPGMHMLSECHTAADVEAQNDETPNTELGAGG